jgi:hypothetical protein
MPSEPERAPFDDGRAIGARGSTASMRDVVPRTAGVAWALAMAWLFVLGLRDHHPELASRLECGTDPRSILRAGEVLDGMSLKVIIQAHCSNARYVSDERIALRYVGAEVDVDLTKLSIGGETYYRIESVGDENAP